MKLRAYKRTILSRQTFKKLISSFLQILGIISLLLGIFDILFPNSLRFGYEGVIAIACISLAGAVLSLFPKKEISHQLSVPDTKITIKVGDLFQEDANLVIGTNDVFDTKKGNIIKPTSIQGQSTKMFYQDNIVHLDQDIDTALQGISGKIDKQKVVGKNKRYPIGTVATLSMGTKKTFYSAYSSMGNNLKCESDIKRLSVSLEKLWEEIRVKGQHDKVAMAVLGSDLARIGNASHSDLIKLIVLSFILASREKLVTPELVIVIHPNNLGKVNMLELEDFLRGF